MNIKVCGFTHVGFIRSNNEDYFIINKQKSLFLLADGMGGHNAGEVASRETCRKYDRYFKPNAKDIKSHLQTAFEKTNAYIFKQAERKSNLQNMGATFIVCHIGNSSAHILHAGDVRAYHFRNGKVRQITEDHSFVRELIKGGQISEEQAKEHPLRHRVIMAVGSRETITPDYNVVELIPGDIILLCSDGLWNMVDDDKILAGLRGDGGIENKGKELINEALTAGGEDNITVILIECGRGTDS